MKSNEDVPCVINKDKQGKRAGFTSWLTTGCSLSLSSSFFCRSWSWDLASASSCWNSDTSWECFSSSALHSRIKRHSSYLICPWKHVLHWVSYVTIKDKTVLRTWLVTVLTEGFATALTARVIWQIETDAQIYYLILQRKKIPWALVISSYKQQIMQ